MKELNKLMKNYLKSKGYYKSGSLYNSIKFNVKFTDSVPHIELETNDYIKYLNDGKFLDSFFELKEVKGVIADLVAEEIVKNLF